METESAYLFHVEPTDDWALAGSVKGCVVRWNVSMDASQLAKNSGGEDETYKDAYY